MSTWAYSIAGQIHRVTVMAGHINRFNNVPDSTMKRYHEWQQVRNRADRQVNTATHVMVASALLSRRNQNSRNRWVIAGALFPDVSIFLLYIWARFIQSTPEAMIWQQLYWQEPWQLMSAVSNSLPLAAGLLLVGRWRYRTPVVVFALALVTHFVLDFPFHADDAHRHFWPFSNWRFHSVFSYWDTAHYASTIMVVEIVLIGLAGLVLWRRFRGWLVRGIILLTLLVYAGVYIYFGWQLS